MSRKSKLEKVDQETVDALRKDFRQERNERSQWIKSTVRRHLERRFGQDPRTGPETSQDFVEYGPGDLYRKVLSRPRFRIEEQITDGNSVATRWTVFGTHDPTKTQITINGVTVTTVKERQVSSDRSIWDASELLKQVGALPER